jgi:hypothetical protein
MSRPKLVLILLLGAVVALPLSGCGGDKGSPTAGGDAGDTEVDGAVGATPDGGDDGTGPGVFAFPKDVVFLTFGKANYPLAIDAPISISNVTLDYRNAYNGENELITSDRVFHLTSRSYDAPGDLPDNQSIKFWWTRSNAEGELKAFICRVKGDTDNYTIKSDQVYEDEPATYSLGSCSWELLLVPAPYGDPEKTQYAIRAPEEGTSGGIHEGGSLFVLIEHGGPTEGYRIRVDGTGGTEEGFFELLSPPAAGM